MVPLQPRIVSVWAKFHPSTHDQNCGLSPKKQPAIVISSRTGSSLSGILVHPILTDSVAIYVFKNMSICFVIYPFFVSCSECWPTIPYYILPGSLDQGRNDGTD